MLGIDLRFIGNAIRNTPYSRVVSLGHYCVTRYQIKRQIGRGPGTLIFDWQTTPPDTLLEYFRRDFRGFFEKEDLVITPSGEVFNDAFKTWHPHEFGEEHQTTQEILDREYANARSRHDYLCEKFRNNLKLDGPVLYVIAAFLSDTMTEELISHLGRHKGHRFHLAMISSDTTNNPTPRREITAIEIDPSIPKPEKNRWEGNDAEWTRAFNRLGVRRRRQLPRSVKRRLTPPKKFLRALGFNPDVR